MDPLHLPPTPPSSHGSDSEGGQSPVRSLPPSSPIQLQATAKVTSRTASALSNSPLLTAPHVSWASSFQHLYICFRFNLAFFINLIRIFTVGLLTAVVLQMNPSLVKSADTVIFLTGLFCCCREQYVTLL